MVEIVNKVNVKAESDEVEPSDLKFAVKRELGRQSGLWSFSQPNGKRSVVWLKEDQKQLVLVEKVSPTS